MKITPKQEKFAQKLVECGSATKAQRFAYDCTRQKPETVNRNAFKNATNIKIIARIKELQGITADKLLVSEDSVLREYARIGFSDIRDLFTEGNQLKNIHSLKKSVSAAVSSIKVVTRTSGRGENVDVEYVHEIKFWNKLSALDLLAKRLGLDGHIGGQDGKSMADELRNLADRLPD